jgi:hypothetical protein
MAQSIRVSDAFYELASQASVPLGRSLAQQVEYWARLGAAVDALGLSSEVAALLLSGPLDLKASVTRLIERSLAPPGAHPQVEHNKAKLANQVDVGLRQPESLFAIPADWARQAHVAPLYAEEPPGKGW